MGTIILSENITLDGVVEDAAGVEGTARGGWFFDTDRGADGEAFLRETTLAAEALLLGRRSYEFFAATWPPRGGELADKMNGMPKYVVSSTLEAPGWDNTTVLAGDVVESVSRLKQELEGEILVLGSPQLARALLEHDLADGLRLMVYPVVLGAGARLFGETTARKPVRLVATQVVGDGISVQTYDVVREDGPADGMSLAARRSAALRRAGIREGGPQRAEETPAT
jgi:dihydrofolate reductase